MKATKPETKKAAAERERDEAMDTLRGILPPGSTVYCILRSVSRTGMSRRISFYAVEDGRMRFLDGYFSRVLGHAFRDRGDGIVVYGCGMDMGFHEVYNLGRTLYPNGFKVEGRGRNGDTSGWDKDGGYALKSEWL